MVGTAQERLCPPYGRICAAPALTFQRSRANLPEDEILDIKTGAMPECFFDSAGFVGRPRIAAAE